MEVLDGQRMVTNKEEVIEKWRNVLQPFLMQTVPCLQEAF